MSIKGLITAGGLSGNPTRLSSPSVIASSVAVRARRSWVVTALLIAAITDGTARGSSDAATNRRRAFIAAMISAVSRAALGSGGVAASRDGRFVIT
jgi:hypothetical protein